MKARIAQLIAGPLDAWSEDGFDAAAQALYRWQLQHNADYRAVAGDTQVEHWTQIPAVPVALFRSLPLTCFPPKRATVVFRTSGTTGAGARGTHRLLDTEVYDLGARRQAEACLGRLPERGLGLVSTAADSSLGHMCARFVPHMPSFFDPVEGVRAAAAWKTLAELSLTPTPLFLPGTAFAWADLLGPDPARLEPIELPPGSLLMVTGGYKGRARAVPEDQLAGWLRRLLPGARLVGEYGMTELSSQLWSVPLGGPFVPPPWLRVLAVDPATGAPLPTGVPGQLRFFDLANHQSVLAIETLDLGAVRADGAVTLRGRIAGAPVRGCSVTVEEAGTQGETG